MTQAIVMVDRDGVICVWNQGAEDLFGYDAASAVGRTLDLIVPEAYRERHWSGFRAAMSTGSTKLDQPAGHLPTLRADGSVVRLPGRLIFLKDARGDAVGAVGIFSSNEGWDGPALPHI